MTARMLLAVARGDISMRGDCLDRLWLIGLLAALAPVPGSADVVIPSSAFSAGRNGAEFHSDVRVFNPASVPIDFVPVFYRSDAAGNVVETVRGPAGTIGARQQIAFGNVLQALFGQAIGAFGPIRLETTGALLVSSSVNDVNACGNGSASGQWLPGIDVGQALRAGTLLQLAASADAATGYRSNLDLMNPGAAPATVAVTIRKGDGTPLAGATIPVGPNGLVQRAIDDASVFPGVAGTTDTNLWVEFTSDVPVLAFASVINNGSGDPFAIVMTAEPAPRVAAPVASFSVSAGPVALQATTFTDTSSNAPVNRFWVFGDGVFDATGGGVVTHAYASPGTYKTALFVDNAGGSSSALKDVVVVSAAPVAVGISATTTGGTHWTFTPNNLTLRVGQAYVLTWTTPAAEATVHGMGGLEALGDRSMQRDHGHAPLRADVHARRRPGGPVVLRVHDEFVWNRSPARRHDGNDHDRTLSAGAVPRGAGDGDRTHDIQLGKLTFYH